MAFPIVQSRTSEVFPDSTTQHLVDMPATVNAGDLLIAEFINIDNTATVTTPTGWTQIATVGDGTAFLRFGIYAKDADGSEGGTTVDFVTSAAKKAASLVYRITGWRDSGTLANDVEAASAIGSSPTPDPPNLDPANWGTEDTLWIACLGHGGDHTVNAYPTNYTNGVFVDGTNANTIGSAERELAAASENPGTFTMSGSAGWVAYTIAIRPAAAVAKHRRNLLGVGR